MTARRIRLSSLTHGQLGALLFLAGHRGEVRLNAGGGSNGIQARTFENLAKMDLIRITPRRSAVFTPTGFALADKAITASRAIAAAIQGIDDRSFLPVAPPPREIDEQFAPIESGDIARLTEARSLADAINHARGYRRWRESV